MEDVKVREMQIFDFKKKIAEAETKLKQQQNLYEAVRSDRNLYSKNLIESQVSHNDQMLAVPGMVFALQLTEIVLRQSFAEESALASALLNSCR